MSKSLLTHIAGAIGTFLIAISFFPQVYTTFTTKTTKGLSFWLLVLTIASAISWLVYAFLIGDKYQILSNCFIVISIIILFILYFLYRNND